jgi:hypothetical protein
MKSKKWKDTSFLQERYGPCSRMSIYRYVKQGILPPPQFPLGPNKPLWLEDELDERDEAAAATARANIMMRAQVAQLAEARKASIEARKKAKRKVKLPDDNPDKKPERKHRRVQKRAAASPEFEVTF